MSNPKLMPEKKDYFKVTAPTLAKVPEIEKSGWEGLMGKIESGPYQGDAFEKGMAGVDYGAATGRDAAANRSAWSGLGGELGAAQAGGGYEAAMRGADLAGDANRANFLGDRMSSGLQDFEAGLQGTEGLLGQMQSRASIEANNTLLKNMELLNQYIQDLDLHGRIKAGEEI